MFRGPKVERNERSMSLAAFRNSISDYLSKRVVPSIYRRPMSSFEDSFTEGRWADHWSGEGWTGHWPGKEVGLANGRAKRLGRPLAGRECWTGHWPSEAWLANGRVKMLGRPMARRERWAGHWPGESVGPANGRAKAGPTIGRAKMLGHPGEGWVGHWPGEGVW